MKNLINLITIIIIICLAPICEAQVKKQYHRPTKIDSLNKELKALLDKSALTKKLMVDTQKYVIQLNDKLKFLTKDQADVWERDDVKKLSNEIYRAKGVHDDLFNSLDEIKYKVDDLQQEIYRLSGAIKTKNGDRVKPVKVENAGIITF